MAGAGMAGLVAATRAVQLGLHPVVRDPAPIVGGAARHSSGVVWRYRSVEDALEACPAASPELVRLVVDRLDDALDWLEASGAVVVARTTGNPLTVGTRIDAAATLDRLAARLPSVRLGENGLGPERPLVVATGGYAARAARERGLILRGSPLAEGGGISFLRTLGARAAGDPNEMYLRVMAAPPARLTPASWVEASQLHGRFATVTDDAGRLLAAPGGDWAELGPARTVAAAPGNRAWYVTGADTAGVRAGGRSVREAIEAARRLGGEVRTGSSPSELGLAALAPGRAGRPPLTAVRVAAGVTHTYAGVAVDAGARVIGEDGTPIPGTYAAGIDVGGQFDGGYASGLASALVLGLAAAESAAAAA